MLKGINGVQLVAITGAVTLLFSCLGRFLMMKTSDGDSVMLLLMAFVLFATLFAVACHAAEIQQYFGICP